MLKAIMALSAAALALAALPAQAQNITAPPPPIPQGITVEEIKVHGASLVGNLEGNDVERQVMVVLPPSYKASPNKRYPVVYYLHGFAIDGKNFYNYMHVPEAVAKSAAAGNEFIVVVPSTLTKMGGSMYSSSVTTGDFRKFIAQDLVQYMDSHYRTIANRGGRGLVGHSMGGYGTWVIGMSYPQVFDSIWAQSACCVSPRTETIESATRMSQVPIEGVDQSGFGMRAGLASAVAWAPNPNNPPFYVDWPVKDGAIDQSVIARWAQNSPLAMVAGHVDALKSFDAIGADVGDKDGLVRDDTLIHEELEKHGIEHEWAIYEGTHTDKIGQRFADVVLPFLAEHLDKAK
jgi:enterochelin esterase-like enzyme